MPQGPEQLSFLGFKSKKNSCIQLSFIEVGYKPYFDRNVAGLDQDLGIHFAPAISDSVW